MALALLMAGTCSFGARADVLEDAKEFILGLKDKAGAVLNDTGIGPAVKDGYNTAVDFVFTYETQPDDEDMESLARSWAVTAWLADEEKVKGESCTYYFDNHSLSMVKDPTKIGRGYNLKKSPAGSGLNGKLTGILKAVVADATNYSVMWVNYDDEVMIYLAQKMKESKGTETEQEE